LKTTRLFIASLLLLAMLTIGCTKKMVVNIDGMPISNHEYNLTNDESGVRVVFILAKYHREYEGKEYIIKPKYLDTFHANRINPGNTELLTLHIKVINPKKAYYTIQWEIDGPSNFQAFGFMYYGELSRKDFSIKLPIHTSGNFTYSFYIHDEAGDQLFNLPRMRYKTKGGIKNYS